ncbi:MAG: hypothetical protein H6766_01635 [Candidatus Peribacteria bacterium]|nr:MAG: hypothetical protein H6766_01635 [Candidatus Peribacteria bacterium]
MTDVWMTGIEMVGLMSVIFFVATAWRRACHDHTVHLLLTHYHRRVAIYVAYFLAYLTLIAALYSLMIFIAILTMFIAGYPPLI